jgi:nickel-dependent lactate racemase
MRQDLEEIGKKVGIHFTLGTLLNEQKNIQSVYFGDPILVMKQAIPDVKEMYGVAVPEPYDLVIASPGGMPKDINLYQAQKGLTPAAQITKDGGWVVLLAACPEGSGSKKFEDYVTQKESHQAIIQQFKDGFFEVGPHKAYQFAQAAVRINFVVISDLPPENLKKWHLTPSNPALLNSLLAWILSSSPERARIALLPNATHTMTEVKNAIR